MKYEENQIILNSQSFLLLVVQMIYVSMQRCQRNRSFFFFFDFNVNFIYLIPSGLHTFQINFKQHISAVMGL